MRAWTDLSKIEMPAGIIDLPRDKRGYPIPKSVLVKPDGEIDFTVIARHALDLYHLDKCGMCGRPLGRHRAFIGGPQSIKGGLFVDPPSHKDCAEYALKVCPFLAAPKFRYLPDEAVDEGFRIIPGVSTKRPEVFGLGICVGRAYTALERVQDLIMKVKEFESVSWWKNGVCYGEDHAEALTAIQRAEETKS